MQHAMGQGIVISTSTRPDQEEALQVVDTLGGLHDLLRRVVGPGGQVHQLGQARWPQVDIFIKHVAHGQEYT